MSRAENYSTGLRLLLGSAAFVVVVAGMKAASDLVLPFLLSVFIAIISEPPLIWLRGRNVPLPIALLVIISTIIGIGVAIALIVGSSINNFTSELPFYEQRVREQLGILVGWLSTSGLPIDSKWFLNVFDPASVFKLAGRMANGIGNLLTNTFLIFITVIFILFEASNLPAKLNRIFDNPEESMARLRRCGENVNRYLAIKTATSILTGVLVTVWLMVLKVDFPLLWGFLAFFLNYVPNIGSIIAALPAILLAFVQLGPLSALWTALGFLVVNNLIGNFVEPRFMGKGLGLSALVVFVSLIFWGWVLGPVGMFLSVPLTMTVKIALENYPDTQWLAILLGNEGSRTEHG